MKEKTLLKIMMKEAAMVAMLQTQDGEAPDDRYLCYLYDNSGSIGGAGLFPGNDPVVLHVEMIERGYFEPSSLKVTLQSLRVIDLKEICGKIKIVKKGRKAEIIDRLVEQLSDNTAQQIMKKMNLYSVSEKGSNFLESHPEYKLIYDYRPLGLDAESYCKELILKDGRNPIQCYCDAFYKQKYTHLSAHHRVDMFLNIYTDSIEAGTPIIEMLAAWVFTAINDPCYLSPLENLRYTQLDDVGIRNLYLERKEHINEVTLFDEEWASYLKDLSNSKDSDLFRIVDKLFINKEAILIDPSEFRTIISEISENKIERNHWDQRYRARMSADALYQAWKVNHQSGHW